MPVCGLFRATVGSFVPSFFVERSLPEALAIVGITLGLMVVVGLLARRARAGTLLGLALIGAVVQGFVPYSYITWLLLYFLSISWTVFRRASRADLRAWFWVTGAVLALQSISLLWSPTFGAVVQAALTTYSVLVCYLLWRRTFREPGGFARALLLGAPGAALLAVMVIVFRLAPDIEAYYLNSPIARVLSEPGVEMIARGRYPNIIDPDKSGGLLLNGNIASLLLLVMAAVYAFGAMAANGRLYRIVFWCVSVSCFLGVFATGSKTPLLLTLALPLLAVGLTFVVRRPIAGSLATIGLLGASGGAAVAVFSAYPSLGASLVNTFGLRTAYWQLALEAFPSNWLLGLGFGGWEELLQANWVRLYGDIAFQGYPVHNFILQAWADGGILLSVSVVVAAAVPVLMAIRAIWRNRKEPLRSGIVVRDVLVFTAISWPVLHALGDVTTYFGDTHTIVFYAGIVALLHHGWVDPVETVGSPQPSAHSTLPAHSTGAE